MLARHLTTWDAGQYVQVKVPVMHAQETRAHCMGHHWHYACGPYYALCMTLLLAKVLIAPLRLLNGHVKQLQTNNP